jgi:hypothetical protein
MREVAMELAQLEAIEDIRKLKAKYFYYLDRKEWDGWRKEVFTADASMQVAEDQAEPRVGLEIILSFLIPVLDGVITIHHGHMPIIEITSPTTATGIWAMEDVLIWPEGARPDGISGRMQGYGHYHETYVRGPNGWRIKTLRLTRLHVSWT